MSRQILEPHFTVVLKILLIVVLSLPMMLFWIPSLGWSWTGYDRLGRKFGVKDGQMTDFPQLLTSNSLSALGAQTRSA